MNRSRLRRVFAFLLGGIAILACNALSGGSQLVSQNPTAIESIATNFLTPTATRTSTPPPTYTPVYSPTPEPLTEDFIAQCEKSFDKNVKQGEVQLPILSLKNVTYREEGWLRLQLDRPLNARTLAEANTIMCTREKRQRAFGYTDGASGYRVILDVRLIEAATGNVIAAKSYVGGEPPSVKSNAGDAYGDFPENRILEEMGIQSGSPNAISLDLRGGPIAFSPDGRYAAHLGGQSDLIQIRDLNSHEIVVEWKPLQTVIDRLAFSPNGQTLLSSSSFTPSLMLWDISTGELLQSLDGKAGIFSPDGDSIAFLYSDEATIIDSVRIWDVAGKRELETISDIMTFPIITDLDFSPSGEILVMNAIPSGVLWSVPDKKVLHLLTPEDASIQSMVFSPDGSRLAIAFQGDTTTIGTWDPVTGEVVRNTGPIGDPAFHPVVYSMEFSPDGQFLAAGLDDGTVRVWETDTWLEIHTLFEDLRLARTVAFSPDSRSLYVGTYEKIQIVDLLNPGD